MWRCERPSVSNRAPICLRPAQYRITTHVTRISRIENAGDNPSYGLVERIAKAFDWELWELAKPGRVRYFFASPWVFAFGGPYFFLAALSHFVRLDFLWYFLHSLNAFASFPALT
jgi:hypothetical protein